MQQGGGPTVTGGWQVDSGLSKFTRSCSVSPSDQVAGASVSAKHCCGNSPQPPLSRVQPWPATPPAPASTAKRENSKARPTTYRTRQTMTTPTCHLGSVPRRRRPGPGQARALEACPAPLRGDRRLGGPGTGRQAGGSSKRLKY